MEKVKKISQKIEVEQPITSARNNINLVIDKILNDKYLTPAKIKALSSVIQALRGTIETNVPNDIPDTDINETELTEDLPQDFSEISGISVDGQPREKVKIYKA